jgi:hypothetical protein
MLICSTSGIGRKTAEHLKTESGKAEFKPITSSYELFGKFLMLRGDGIGSRDHCEQFYVFLKEKGISENAHDIVRAVAEMANIFVPDLYNGNSCHFGTIRHHGH